MPHELEKIPKQYEDIMRQMEEDIIADIVMRIKKNKEITRTADYEIYRLHEMGKSKWYIKHRIKKALDLTFSELRKLYKQVLAEDYAREEKLYRFFGARQIPFSDNIILQQDINAVIEHTENELRNITRTTGFTTYRFGNKQFVPSGYIFKVTLDKVMIEVQNGTRTYEQAIKETVHEMTLSGIKSVDYTSGVKRNVVGQARTCIMTGLEQITGKITDQNMEKLGTQFVETSAHLGARNKGEGPENHEKWQGRVFYWNKDNPMDDITVDGVHYESFIQSTGYGSIEGLCGINCRHNFHPFIPGISKPLYTEEQLKALNDQNSKKIKYNGRQYDGYTATQHMRKLERIMRKQREELNVLKKLGLDDEDYTLKQCRYQATRQEYQKFADAMKLPTEYQRVYADGLGRLSNAYIAKSVQNDIIKKEIQKLGFKGEIHLTPTKIDISKLTFDDKHINNERNHNVTFDEAKSYIENAKISQTVWKGKYERYFSENGAAYVDNESNQIRTAFSSKQYTDNIIKMMEVLNKNEG